MTTIEDLFADRRLVRQSSARPELLPEPEAEELWCPIISVDDHVLEPPGLFERVSRKHRDLVPGLVYNSDGLPYWMVDGEAIGVAGNNGSAGIDPTEWKRESLRMEDMRRGVWDPDHRVLDLDVSGVWASLCFPSEIWGFAGWRFARMRDRTTGFACVQAYNDWMIEEWCGSHPDRFIPCQLTWLADPLVAAAEIRRNAERGFKAVSFSENPERLGFSSLYSGDWDPFFAACQETQTVVNMHVGSSGNVPRPSKDTPLLAINALFFVNAVEALIDWIFSRVPMRFPDIRIVLSEGGLSWVPAALERLAHAHDVRAMSVMEPWLDSDPHPVEVALRNFSFTSLRDPAGFRLLDVIGESSVMVETDYPHGDSSWPATQSVIAAQLGGFPEATIRKVCFENAACLYRHSPPPPGLLASAAALPAMSAETESAAT